MYIAAFYRYSWKVYHFSYRIFVCLNSCLLCLCVVNHIFNSCCQFFSAAYVVDGTGKR
jgi:hypothetical protein